MGPTGVGKTDLAVALAELGRVDIVSVDSAMVYRGLDIGSGKPDAATLARAPHRLIDIREPEQAYSAAEFRVDALEAIESIHAADRIPLLVGGTGLYFRALKRGLSRLPRANPAIRRRLDEDMQRVGLAAMHDRLRQLDPESAGRIHPNDPQRIQRALEVYELTGSPMSALIAARNTDAMPYPSFEVVLAPAERGVLHWRIEQRFDQMLAAGLVDEVRDLRARPRVHKDLPAMRAVGYRQVWEHLDGEVDFEHMRARAVAATRQLARRQLTWLRAQKVATWLEPGAHTLTDFRVNAQRCLGIELCG